MQLSNHRGSNSFIEALPANKTLTLLNTEKINVKQEEKKITVTMRYERRRGEWKVKRILFFFVKKFINLLISQFSIFKLMQLQSFIMVEWEADRRSAERHFFLLLYNLHCHLIYLYLTLSLSWGWRTTKRPGFANQKKNFDEENFNLQKCFKKRLKTIKTVMKNSSEIIPFDAPASRIMQYNWMTI